MKRLKYIMLFFLLAASGCYLPARASASRYIHMSEPNEGPSSTMYVMPVNQTLALSAEGRIIGGGANNIRFYIFGPMSGGIIDTVPVDSTAERPTAQKNWTPATAGIYWAQAELTAHDGAGVISAPVKICVLNISSPAAGASLFMGNGYSGPCSIPPAPTVPRGTSTSVSIHATASPVSLAYFPPTCTNLGSDTLILSSISFDATINDPSGRVALVTVSIFINGFNDSFILNQVGGAATGTRHFSGGTDDLDGVLIRVLGGGTGTLNWTARAFDQSGAIIAQQIQNMLVGPCTPPVHAETIASPTPTLITILPTFTPASAQDCPSGTYYADVTHQCIPVATPTTGNGSSGPTCKLSVKTCAPKKFDPTKCICY